MSDEFERALRRLREIERRHPTMYILDENEEPVPCSDFKVWGPFCDAHRRVALTLIDPPGVNVSTVFLGVAHGRDRDERPVLWETMAFYERDVPDRKLEFLGLQERYVSAADARVGHERVVAMLRVKFGEVAS